MSRPAKILKRTQAAVAPLFTILIIVLPGAPAFAQSSPEYSSERSYSSEHSEDDQRFSFGTETDLSSDYAWRGIVLGNRPVVQPSVWISASGFALIAARNITPANVPESVVLHTTDLTLTYGRDWKNLRIEPAIEGYLNGRLAGVHDPNTMEGQLKLSYPAGPLRVFTLLHDARPALIRFAGAFDITPWPSRVRQIDARYNGAWELPVLGAVAAPTAVLIRPDGHVAWVGEGTDHGLRDALATWFGSPDGSLSDDVRAAQVTCCGDSFSRWGS